MFKWLSDESKETTAELEQSAKILVKGFIGPIKVIPKLTAALEINTKEVGENKKDDEKSAEAKEKVTYQSFTLRAALQKLSGN